MVLTWRRKELGNECLMAADSEEGFRVRRQVWLCSLRFMNYIYASLHLLMPPHSHGGWIKSLNEVALCRESNALNCITAACFFLYVSALGLIMCGF